MTRVWPRVALAVVLLAIGRSGLAETGASDVSQETIESSDPVHWGVSLGLSHMLGAGAFVRNDTLRATHTQWTQLWNVAAYLDIPAFGRTLRFSASSAMGVELTTPNRNPPRRIEPQLTWLGVDARNLYKEPWLGLSVSAGASLFLPTRYIDRMDQLRLGVRGRAGLDGRWGDWSSGYQFSMGKGFYDSEVASAYRDQARAADDVRSLRDGGVFSLGMGRMLPRFDIWNSVYLSYGITGHLSLSYSLLTIHQFNYAATDVADALTATHADIGMGQRDFLVPQLELAYALSTAWPRAFDWLSPFSLSARLGLMAIHPAQDRGNDFLWPFFWSVFANNRAATNEGAAYLTLSFRYDAGAASAQAPSLPNMAQ